MKILTSAAGALAGAIALNLLHETAKHFVHDAPRVDLVGEEALTNIAESTGTDAPTGNALYAATLTGDILSNALYYSIIGFGKNKHILLRGAVYGLAAGIGAVELTKPLGLNDAPVTRTNVTKALTVTWYLFGGVVTAFAIKAFRKV